MRYLRIETGEWAAGSLPNWPPLLKAVLPLANPDLEELYGRTSYWWLEVEESGAPSREIGFSPSGDAVVLGPVGENVGFLTDASDDWRGYDAESPEAAASFDAVWDELWPVFAHLERG